MKFARAVGITAIGLSSLLSVPGHAQNIINTVAGGGKVGGRALAADIAGPTGVVKDSKGNIYITPARTSYLRPTPRHAKPDCDFYTSSANVFLLTWRLAWTETSFGLHTGRLSLPSQPVESI